ncbi:MAG: hypothetical protein OXC40_07280 [Proteobacteria bacterium]|nr:hypothetical protein [Pseudomonadota bacterium]
MENQSRRVTSKESAEMVTAGDYQGGDGITQDSGQDGFVSLREYAKADSKTEKTVWQEIHSGKILAKDLDGVIHVQVKTRSWPHKGKDMTIEGASHRQDHNKLTHDPVPPSSGEPREPNVNEQLTQVSGLVTGEVMNQIKDHITTIIRKEKSSLENMVVNKMNLVVTMMEQVSGMVSKQNKVLSRLSQELTEFAENKKELVKQSEEQNKIIFKLEKKLKIQKKLVQKLGQEREDLELLNKALMDRDSDESRLS